MTTVAVTAAATTSQIRSSLQLVEVDVSPLLFKRPSDESLGSRLASGEAAAFDELYRRYSNRLAAYGSHLLGDAASGDDVAQATMLKAYAALRDGRVPDKMKPWLFRIAHNAAIDLVVRRRELPSGDLPDTPSIDREPFAGALVEALATLPDRQRRVYVLREVHGLRIDETAAELGLTAPQVEQSLFAARNRLAEQLVFGDRLNCVTVQRLAAGPLDLPERRALKTHLRACGECRQTLGVRGRALALFPSGAGLEWLRGLANGLIGGGAPVVAKVGAIFATATIVGGGTVAVEKTTRHHAHRGVLTIARTTPATGGPVRLAALASVAVPVSMVAKPSPHVAPASEQSSSTHDREATQVAEHDSPSPDSSEGDVASKSGGDSHNASEGGEHTVTTQGERSTSSDSGASLEHSGTTQTAGTDSRSGEATSSDSGGSTDGPSTSTSTEPTTTTTTTTASPALTPPPPLPVVTVPAEG